MRNAQALKRDVCRRETAVQGTDVVRLRERDLVLDLLLPRTMRDLSLRDARVREARIDPGHGSVAVLEGPVALYGLSTYMYFRSS